MIVAWVHSLLVLNVSSDQWNTIFVNILHHSIFMCSKCFYLFLLKLQALSNLSSYSNGLCKNAVETLLCMWYLVENRRGSYYSLCNLIFDSARSLYLGCALLLLQEAAWNHSNQCRCEQRLHYSHLHKSKDFCIDFHFQRVASAYYINLIPEFDILKPPWLFMEFVE